MDTTGIHEMAAAENSLYRMRITNLINDVGPLLSSQSPDAVDHTRLAQGLRLEAAIQANISGVLAIKGVPIISTDEPGSVCQRLLHNTTDGMYDYIEAQHRCRDCHSEWKPLTSDQLAAVRQFEDLLESVGVVIEDGDHRVWWRCLEMSHEDHHLYRNSSAFELYRTLECYGLAPPFTSRARDGSNETWGPQVVNAWEHVEAQLYALRASLLKQRGVLQHLIDHTEDILVATYEQLYTGAPGSDADLARRFHARDGEPPGGLRAMKQWADGWKKCFAED
ncbi:unnamed protein product [Peniophora sp. CBMAI 1063]|nr:unnamed protein product [Peniophora sp. CBMAI 1063]